MALKRVILVVQLNDGTQTQMNFVQESKGGVEDPNGSERAYIDLQDFGHNIRVDSWRLLEKGEVLKITYVGKWEEPDKNKGQK